MPYSECLSDDIECQQNVAYLSKTDQDCKDSGKTGNPTVDAVTNPVGQWFCVQGKGATKYAQGTGGQNILGGMGQNGMIVLVIIAVVIFMIMR